jgi:hypothetical protein
MPLIAPSCCSPMSRKTLGDMHADLLDLEHIIDFSHGSFRLMGSRKPKHIQKVARVFSS